MDRSIIRSWRETADCRHLMGSIAYSLALVAAGQIDGVINIGTQNEWDIAAALLLVQKRQEGRPRQRPEIHSMQPTSSHRQWHHRRSS